MPFQDMLHIAYALTLNRVGYDECWLTVAALETIKSIEELLNVIPDSVEREEVLEKLIPEIEADIEETAVREFTSADVEIALARALYKKLS